MEWMSEMGQDAALALEMLMRSSDRAERERLRRVLLDYCRQDTFALVRVLERLRLEGSRSRGVEGGRG
jgi:hypothetical protein